MMRGEFGEVWRKDTIPGAEKQPPGTKNLPRVTQLTENRRLIGQIDDPAHIAGDTDVILRRHHRDVHRRRLEGRQKVRRKDIHEKTALSPVDKQTRQCKDRPFDVDRKPGAGAERTHPPDNVTGEAHYRGGITGFDMLHADRTGQLSCRNLPVTVHQHDQRHPCVGLQNQCLDDRVFVDSQRRGCYASASVFFIPVETGCEGDVPVAQEADGGSCGDVRRGHGANG